MTPEGELGRVPLRVARSIKYAFQKRSSARRAGLMHVPCARATADGVPRLLGTHTRGTHCSSRAVHCWPFLRSLSRSHISAVCAQRGAAWYGSPLYARMCIWDCAHHSPPQLNPPPAHICTESIPCPPLHRERVRPPPASAPQPTPSLADICATTAALRDICLCATQV